MKKEGWYDRFIYRWHIDGRPVEKLSVGFAPEGEIHAGDILRRADGSEQEVLRVEPHYKYIGKSSTQYNFEKDLGKNPLPMSVVNARRFARAVEAALEGLEMEARCYSLYDEDYYLDTKAFLEKMLARLKAPHAIPAEEVYRDLGITAEDIAGGEDVEIE